MSGKTGKQHWYQVHKAKAGSNGVAQSHAVREATAQVREAEAEVSRCRREVSETLGSGLRRLIFGMNAKENLLQQASQRLDAAKATARQAEADARRRGEQAYRDDWADRNPEKIRQP
jgi:hypothetical protein